jgi:hypothetical protein
MLKALCFLVPPLVPLQRGKFRPRLEQLAQSNADDVVQSQSKKALEMLLEGSKAMSSAKESLLILNTLRGVGPATSSAVLAAHSPESLSFMSDEALEAAAGLDGKPKYTMKEWQWYNEAMQKRADDEEWEGGVGGLEEAAWAYVVLKRHHVLEKSRPAKVDEKSEVKGSKRSSSILEDSTPAPQKSRKTKR